MPVYVIQAGEGPCKIGFARDVKSRLSALQTSHHEQLRLVAAYEGDEADERMLHKQFAASRLKGEWFNISPENALRDITLTPQSPDAPVVAVPKPLTPDGLNPVTKRPEPHIITLMDERGLEPVGVRRIGPGYYDPEIVRMSNAFSEKRGEVVVGVDLVRWPTVGVGDKRSRGGLRIARNFVRTRAGSRNSDEPLDSKWIPPARQKSPAEREAVVAWLMANRSRPA